MSINIDPREVLYYLNELGYTHISGKQLKSFVKDLKKLIKYDERQHVDKENVVCSSSSTQSTKEFVVNHCKDDENVFHVLYKTSTAASRGKQVNERKENVIRVEINRPIIREPSKSNTSHSITHTCRSTLTDVNEKVSTDTKSVPKSGKTSSVDDAKTNKELHRPKSFIRPRLEPKPCKSDPVALYHRYQEEWKKIKIPGTDNRADIRWRIRERMLGGPASR